MISTDFRVEFPPDVTVCDSSLYDGALDQSYPVNDTGKLYLDLLRAGEPMTDIVDAVSARFDIPKSDVKRDLLDLVARLNSAQLVNVHPRRVVDRLKRLLFVAGFVIVMRDFPPILVKRGHVADGGPMRVAFSVTRVLFKHALPAMTVFALCIFVLAMLTTVETAYPFGGALIAILAALILHEIGHALAVQLAGRRSYIIMTGIKVGIVHTLKSSPTVHAAGPLLAGMVGFVMMLAAYAANSDALAFMSTPFVLQLVSLTALTRDGRFLVDSLSSTRKERRNA